MACQWRACNDANGWKLIAARLNLFEWGTIFGNGGPILAANLVRGDQFWQNFCQNQSQGDHFWGGPILV